MSTEKLTAEQRYDLGFEIISGMHASARRQDIEMGRLETKAGTILPTPEELATEGLTEIPDYCYRAVEWEKKRLDDQIAFIVGVVLEKLDAMGLMIIRSDQVEWQAKQLKEERDKAIDILASAQRVLSNHLDIQPKSAFHASINEFLNKLNQNNEG